MAFTGWVAEQTGTKAANFKFSNIVSNLVYLVDGSYNFWSYNVVTKTYTQLGTSAWYIVGLPVQRGTKVYVVGNEGGTYPTDRSLIFYNISAATWTQSSNATIGGKTYQLSTLVFADDDTIWIWGKYNTEIRCLKYTISTDTWTAYANSTTVQVTEAAAIKTDGSVVYGSKLDGAYCKYTIATDTYTEVADIGRDFEICTDDDKLWYNAEGTPWAKGYLDTADDSLHDTVIPGNTTEVVHRLAAIDDAITMALNSSRQTGTTIMDSNGIHYAGIVGTVALATSLFIPTVTTTSTFIPRVFIM